MPVTVSIRDTMPAGTGRLWEPVAAEETQRLALPALNRATIIAEATDVLGKCLPPDASANSRTGLVTGYVQSGKTLSFTTVAALARDNGFRAVIVIVGTTRNLHQQSHGRLREDLGIGARGAAAPWRHIDSPTTRQSDHIAIEDCLADWDDDAVPPHERKTLLITVLKGHARLRHLNQVIARCPRLASTPTIIIDDEGDQAGLNSEVNQGDQSTTYARLMDLKSLLGCHSYLLYTATPQAPLLINIADVLAPDFCVVLSPGDGYTGGSTFFADGSRLVSEIPVADIPTRAIPLQQPPDSLLNALRIYFVGVAVGIVVEDSAGNRSMLVHPSSQTAGHSQYGDWVRAVRTQWVTTLETPEGDPDRSELLDEFSLAFDDLKSSGLEGISFAQVVPRLLHAVRRTIIKVVNSLTDTNIDWAQAYSWILVGGQAMDRGFTVNGLTVTYMPRLLGVGNADTVQQRARFFGYKQQYLPLCRAYLESAVLAAFREYLEHEEDIRHQLAAVQRENASLKDWKRRFLLTGLLQPTRDSVIDVAYQSVKLGGDWIVLLLDHPTALLAAENVRAVTQFCDDQRWTEWTDGDERGAESLRNHVAAATRNAVTSGLLTVLAVPRVEESRALAAVLRLLGKHAARLDREGILLFQMSGGQPRERAVDGAEIRQLFQGPQYAQRRKVYPGDRHVKDEHRLTIQIHWILKKQNDGTVSTQAVPALAVWIPDDLDVTVIEQPQGTR